MGTSVKRFNGTDADLLTMPNQCPQCHHTMTPHPLFSYNANGYLNVFLRCSNEKCFHGFVGIFSKGRGDWYEYEELAINRPAVKTFSEHIKSVSPNFVSIFNESFHAEQLGMKQICGVGFRKAIEYLIKDYLISTDINLKESVEKKLLGQCISDNISNPNIKEMSKRAVWLGNDETHYVRKWEDKDVSDLKRLIEVTIHWVDMEMTTKEYLEGMEDGKK